MSERTDTERMTKIRLRFVPGDVVVLTMAPTRRMLEKMSRVQPPASWSRAATRILKRRDRWGFGVSEVSRQIRL